PGAGADQVLDFGIGLGACQFRIELNEYDLGNGQVERARDFARDQFRDQRLRALAGAAKLEHVQAVVVGLDHRRQRSALAQRRNVAGGIDGAKLHGLLEPWANVRSAHSRPRNSMEGPMDDAAGTDGDPVYDRQLLLLGAKRNQELTLDEVHRYG